MYIAIIAARGSLGVIPQEVVHSGVVAPALRRSPRDHAAGLVCPEGKSAKPAAREIGARESSASVRSGPMHTHAISRVAAKNAFGAGGRFATGAERVQTKARIEHVSPRV